MILDNIANFTLSKTNANTTGCSVPVPWWNNNCERTVEEIKHTFNKYNKDRNVENLTFFKCRTISKRTINNLVSVIYIFDPDYCC